MTENKRTRGRPKTSTPANSRLPHIRVREDQLEMYKAAAQSCDMRLSAWVKMVLDTAVSKEKPENSEK